MCVGSKFKTRVMGTTLLDQKRRGSNRKAKAAFQNNIKTQVPYTGSSTTNLVPLCCHTILFFRAIQNPKETDTTTHRVAMASNEVVV